MKTSSSYQTVVAAVTEAQAVRITADKEIADLIEQYKSCQDQFQQLLLKIPIHERNYERSALKQSIVSLAVEMSPPGKPSLPSWRRRRHGHFDAANCDFTALLAEQHVKTKGLPQAPPRSYDDDYRPLARQRPKEAETLHVAAVVEAAN